jgi:Uma2 family endonuclease
MAAKTTAPPAATFDDLVRARDAGRAVELVRGEIVEKAAPSAEHGLAETKLGASLDPYNRRADGLGGPGGWWIFTEVEVRYPGTSEVFRHDLCGFCREHHPERPTGVPLKQRPEWVCEILSKSSARVDLVKKQRTLHAHGVEHYWIVDPDAETLSVYRHEAGGYLLALASTTGETVRAEPFEAIELTVGALFGRED